LALIILDDATGVGIADDSLVAPLFAGFAKGLMLIF